MIDTLEDGGRRLEIELRGAAQDLFFKYDLREWDEVFFDGPAGCVAGETELWDPVAGVGRRIDELCWSATRPVVLTLRGPVLAEVPFLKGFAPLYRVTLASGRSCLATSDHRFLSSASEGALLGQHVAWRTTSSLAPGMALLSTSLGGAPRSTRTGEDSQGRCSTGRRRHGRPLHRGEVDGRACVPSGSDARAPAHACSPPGGRASEPANSRPCPASARRAKPDSIRQTYCASASSQLQAVDSSTTAAQCRDDQCTCERGFSSFRLDSRSSPESRPLRQVERQERGVWSKPTYGQSELVNPCQQYGSQWDRIASIEYERTDFFYDLHVPGPEHYLADGIWSHNTGKTLAILLWMHNVAVEYPGANLMIARKTRDSMTASCLRTFEEQILSVDAPEVMAGRDRSQRESYQYSNGSRITIGGIADVERAKSAEYDAIYINEVTEAMQKDYEYLTTRLRKSTKRKNACPYKVLISDANPSYPSHHINERFSPKCKLRSRRLRLLSKHEDNPMLWDDVAKCWTDDEHGGGESYIRKLDSLTGANKQRMRYGLWVGEEGLVYEEFDPDYHVIKACDVPPILYYVGAYDPSPSSRNASVLQIWGIDEDERAYMVREAHMVGKGIDWWAEQALRFYHDYRPRLIWCDPSNPGMIELFNNRLGARYGNVASRIAVKANNDQNAGIAQMKSALTREMHAKNCPAGCQRNDRHGKARMYFVDGALSEYDHEKDKDGIRRPRNTPEELLQLVWKTTKDGQQARDEWDPTIPHDGADCARYLAMGNERRGLGTRRAKTKNPYQPGSAGFLMWQEGRRNFEKRQVG